MAAEYIAAGVKLLAKPLEDLYTLGKEAAAPRIARWRQSKHVGALYKKIDSVQKVKTIWQIDKEVKIMTFYYPSRVIVDGKPKTVNNIEELSPSGNFVIQGIVGQGKSIFLRYLCIRTLAESKRIPIFLELRRIDKTQTFRRHLYAIVATLGFDVDDALFDLYASSGKFVLLLDGFDELDSDLVSGVVNELELLAQQYPSLQMIITSRPESGIEKSPPFRVFRLALLEHHEYKNFLQKIVPEAERVDDILGAIKASSSEIKDLLRTPLMLTLLVIVYKSDQKIPTALSEFYENLFQTLLVRHDATKPGFSRRRHCKLSDSDLKILFEAFCFVVKQKGLLVLTEEQFTESLGVASTHTGIKCDPKGFVQDITKVACLMQEEGFRYHFIHKSVLEFNTASFIRHSHNDLALKFYSKLRERLWGNWQQELVFLSDIDKFRFTKYFHIPSMHDALKELGVDPNVAQPPQLSIDQVHEYLRGHEATVMIDPTSNHLHIHSLSLRGYGYAIQQFELRYISDVFDAGRLESDHPDIAIIREEVQAASLGSPPGRYTLPLGDWLARVGTLPVAQPIVNRGITFLLKQLRAAEAFIALEESKENLLTI